MNLHRPPAYTNVTVQDCGYPTHVVFEYKFRFRVFSGLILAIVGVLVLRLVWLQVIDSRAYTGESRSNALREVRVLPARGVIYDRNGVLMVDNQLRYSISLTARYFDRSRVHLLADLLGVPDSLVVRELEDARQWNSFRPRIAFTDLTLDVIGRVEENRYRLPGVDFEVSQRRRYLTDANAWHALGYVREITEDGLDKWGPLGYRQGDMIGKAGIERTYERELRGELGAQFKLVNKFGREFKSYRDRAADIDPVSGFDLVLTVDSKVQALAESLFVNKRGAAIALDPSTGGIIALVSEPSVDPRIFSGSVPGSTWVDITTSEDKPLFNRATMSGMPPGSTWKPFMSLVGLQTGLITEHSKYQCRGRYVLGNRAFRDFNEIAHGSIDVVDAIQHSCNSFFFNLMMQIDVNEFKYWATQFGFGKRLPIDIGEQDAGLIPDSTYYNTRYPSGWTPGYSINLGIGQGDMTVTPMQLARYVAAIANGGWLHTPHFVARIIHPETGEELEVQNEPSKRIPIDAKHFATVREGMHRVVEFSSGRGARIDGITAGGKTGTAQAPGDAADHSLFIMFAPLEDPKIALAVLVENGGFGATQAAPIASLMAEQYLKGELSPLGLARARYLMTLESE